MQTIPNTVPAVFPRTRPSVRANNVRKRTFQFAKTGRFSRSRVDGRACAVRRRLWERGSRDPGEQISRRPVRVVAFLITRVVHGDHVCSIPTRTPRAPEKSFRPREIDAIGRKLSFPVGRRKRCWYCFSMTIDFVLNSDLNRDRVASKRARAHCLRIVTFDYSTKYSY